MSDSSSSSTSNEFHAHAHPNPHADQTGVNKDQLYGRFEDGEERRRRREDDKHNLYMKTAHKALDVARDLVEDEMGDFNTTINRTGVPPWVVIVLLVLAALAMLAPLIGIGVHSWLTREPTAKPAEPTPLVDTDTHRDLQFTDPKGTGWQTREQ